MAISRCPQEALLCPSWARVGPALPAPTPLTPAWLLWPPPHGGQDRDRAGSSGCVWVPSLAVEVVPYETVPRVSALSSEVALV